MFISLRINNTIFFIYFENKARKSKHLTTTILLWFLRLWLLIQMGQKILVHDSQSENISGRQHIVYVKRHTHYRTYALPKCSICAQRLNYDCWGRYNVLIYLLSCLSEFYYTEDFCILCLVLNIYIYIGHFICDIEILDPISF